MFADVKLSLETGPQLISAILFYHLKTTTVFCSQISLFMTLTRLAFSLPDVSVTGE
jgi:hypothetical protein